MQLTLTHVLTAFGGMGSVIAALWVLIKGYMKRESDRLKKYEELDEKRQAEIVELTGDHRELKGRIDGIESFNSSAIVESIDLLGKKMLNEIKNINKD